MMPIPAQRMSAGAVEAISVQDWEYQLMGQH
jgi:hypothetical protein